MHLEIRTASRSQTKKHLALVTFRMWFNFLFFEKEKSRVSDPDWIRIQSGQWIRIQEGKNDPQK
jgi:hypothetical protein